MHGEPALGQVDGAGADPGTQFQDARALPVPIEPRNHLVQKPARREPIVPGRDSAARHPPIALDVLAQVVFHARQAAQQPYRRHFAETDGLETVPDWESWAQQVCERLFLRSGSPLREEGEGLLARELRRNYLAILRTLAERPGCTHAELRDALPGLSLGPYLNAVTNDLRLVERKLPIFAGERQRRARYTITDQFLCAWLRVMQPASQAARVLPAPRVAQRALAALRTLEGHAFERMVGEATEEASRAGAPDYQLTDRITGYWNRPQPQPGSVEIDFIAWNEEERRVRFGSCKRNPDRHDGASLRGFRDHVDRFLATGVGRRFTGWQHEFALFAPRFTRQQRVHLEADDWICRDLADFQRMLCRAPAGLPGTLLASPKLNGAE